MKHTFLSFLLLLLSIVANAETVEIGGIYYYLGSDLGTAQVIENPYNYYGDIVIPESITYCGVEYSVYLIQSYAFYYCRDLTSITIPSTVVLIGVCAFQECSSLTSVNIPNSVASIFHFAFYHCI